MVDEETDEGERQDVEQGDAPEDLLDRRRERPGRVLGFGSSETDEFSTGEGESSRDEDTTETEEIGERARVLPSLSTLVLGISAKFVSTVFG